MNLLAVTYATVFLLSASCEDDVLKWNAADADVAELRLSLDGATVEILPPQTTSYALGCLSGLACLTASDSSGNVSAAACFQWEPDPGVYAEFGPCLLGVDRPKRDPRACTAPLASEP